MQNNVSVCMAAGDQVNATRTREELSRLEAVIAGKERLTAMRELTEEVKRMRTAVESLRSRGMME